MSHSYPPYAVLSSAMVVVWASVASSALAAGPSRSRVETVSSLPKTALTLSGKVDYHVTSPADPSADGGVIRFASPDAWLFLDNIPPSRAASSLLARIRVADASASLDTNLRIVQYGQGSVIFPQAPDFAGMTVFDRPNFAGTSMPLQCYEKYDDAALGTMKSAIRSFRLKRGFMATIAEKENGTGVSHNFVAQDCDIDIPTLPSVLDKNIHFIRVFPWRWASKKGVAGNIWEKLSVGWFYDWNIGRQSTPDLEYVPIRQKRWWPGLNQDWKARGATHLLGYNEPDHKDQSNLSVGDALNSWPDLMGTGLRLGSPAVSDGGLKWLFEFVEKADAANLRVDFIAVHYYRAPPNPADPKGATDQFYRFLKEIHDRTKRPIWITEFNNGANWTGKKPTYEQEAATIASFVEMLDQTPFVERYAVYNWVEDTRMMVRKDDSLTAAGEAYRNKVSPISYVQQSP